jgi:TPR repeat protein
LAAEQGSVVDQFYSGYCCENGIGTEEYEKKAFEYYELAAKNADVSAKKK